MANLFQMLLNETSDLAKKKADQLMSVAQMYAQNQQNPLQSLNQGGVPLAGIRPGVSENVASSLSALSSQDPNRLAPMVMGMTTPLSSEQQAYEVRPPPGSFPQGWKGQSIENFDIPRLNVNTGPDFKDILKYVSDKLTKK